jgi:hypothetical protein
MDYKTLLLIGLILYILFKFNWDNDSFQNNKKEIKEIDETFADVDDDNLKKKQCHRPILSSGFLSDIVTDYQMWDKENSEACVNLILPNFLDTKYHKDYQDVINGLNLIIPCNHSLFNVQNLPVDYKELDNNSGKPFIQEFITQLNNLIENEVMIEPCIESGWDKYNKNLKLSPIYSNPVGKTLVYLIDIISVKQYTTDHEIKYTCEFVVQKFNVADQMKLKVDFLIERDKCDEDGLFNNKVAETKVKILQTIVVGYMSNDINNYGRYETVDEFYPYEEIEKNDLTDPDMINKILYDKYMERMAEIQYRNCQLDEEGRVFQSNIGNKINKYPEYKPVKGLFD